MKSATVRSSFEEVAEKANSCSPQNEKIRGVFMNGLLEMFAHHDWVTELAHEEQIPKLFRVNIAQMAALKASRCRDRKSVV